MTKEPIHARLASLADDDDQRIAVDDIHIAASRLLSFGRCVDPFEHPWTPIGLTSYLREYGVLHWDGPELCSPIRLRAIVGGYGIATPARWTWPRAAALCLLFEQLRSKLDEAIDTLWWWRPPQIAQLANAKTARTTDHLTASAIDIRLRTPRAYDIARRHLDELYRCNVLGLSLGFYSESSRRIHVGIFAPRTLDKGAQRRW